MSEIDPERPFAALRQTRRLCEETSAVGYEGTRHAYRTVDIALDTLALGRAALALGQISTKPLMACARPALLNLSPAACLHATSAPPPPLALVGRMNSVFELYSLPAPPECMRDD